MTKSKNDPIKKPNNPAAFPYIETGDSGCRTGMDLRDYFAAKAMQATVSSNEAMEEMGSDDESGDEILELVATFSYQMADKMLKARAR